MAQPGEFEKLLSAVPEWNDDGDPAAWAAAFEREVAYVGCKEDIKVMESATSVDALINMWADFLSVEPVVGMMNLCKHHY